MPAPALHRASPLQSLRRRPPADPPGTSAPPATSPPAPAPPPPHTGPRSSQPASPGCPPRGHRHTKCPRLRTPGEDTHPLTIAPHLPIPAEPATCSSFCDLTSYAPPERRRAGGLCARPLLWHIPRVRSRCRPWSGHSARLVHAVHGPASWPPDRRHGSRKEPV
jgi:hypothetical protein